MAGLPIGAASPIKLRTTWEVSYLNDPRVKLSKRALAVPKKQATRETLEEWHKRFLGGHFIVGAIPKYGMQRRAVKTIFEKRKHYGHNKPLVEKGLSESLLKLNPRISATSKAGTLTMRGPFYLGLRTKKWTGGLSPDLKSEITAVTPREGKFLARVFQERLVDGVKKYKAAKSKKTLS